MGGVRVGTFPPFALLPVAGARRDAILALIADQRIDHIGVGDHVSFFVGAGSDALITATSLLPHRLRKQHPDSAARRWSRADSRTVGAIRQSAGRSGTLETRPLRARDLVRRRLPLA